MARGPKKHLKRLAAPSHWMLDKLGGVFVSKFFVCCFSFVFSFVCWHADTPLRRHQSATTQFNSILIRFVYVLNMFLIDETRWNNNTIFFFFLLFFVFLFGRSSKNTTTIGAATVVRTSQVARMLASLLVVAQSSQVS
jgi:hypothetical protein